MEPGKIKIFKLYTSFSVHFLLDELMKLQLRFLTREEKDFSEEDTFSVVTANC